MLLFLLDFKLLLILQQVLLLPSDALPCSRRSFFLLEQRIFVLDSRSVFVELLPLGDLLIIEAFLANFEI